MRNAMIDTVSKMIRNEPDTSLFLVDIGVWAFRDILKTFPDRAINAGIFEDGMISVAAGMSLRGIIPTVYGISPFIVERALEQLKLDFAYQCLKGNFISTGASYDFSTLGYSHYCPEDLNILKSIPGFEFVAPGSPREFSTLFDEAHRDNKPTYFRCSDYSNKVEMDVYFGKATIVQKGTQGTVIAVSTTLDIVLEACKGEDVSILYYTTLEPFDYDTLSEHYNKGNILVVHPFLEGSLHYDIMKAFGKRKCMIDEIGHKRVILRQYGTKMENDAYLGYTSDNVRLHLEKLI